MADDDTTGQAPDTTTDDAAAADRLDALEDRQDGMDSKLDRILELLPGGNPKPAAPAAGTTDTATGQGPGDVQSQVRAEIAAAKQREAEEARRKGDSDRVQAIEQQIEELKAEKTPREPQGGFLGGIRRVMYGKDDS